MSESFKIIGSGLKYPVLETVLEDPRTGKAWLVPQCCFGDLLAKEGCDDLDLAGMGEAIIGNICQGLHMGTIQMHFNAYLNLRLAEGAENIPLPWPGMPDDSVIPLDLCKMPFETEMFLDTSESRYKYRLNRQQMVLRIQANWVPYLKAKMAFGGVETIA